MDSLRGQEIPYAAEPDVRVKRKNYVNLSIPKDNCRQSRLSILATPAPTTGWSSGCHFRRVCLGGSCHVFSLDLLRISVAPHKFVRIFVSPGGRGSGCHFRPAVGARLGYVKESQLV